MKESTLKRNCIDDIRSSQWNKRRKFWTNPSIYKTQNSTTRWHKTADNSQPMVGCARGSTRSNLLSRPSATSTSIQSTTLTPASSAVAADQTRSKMITSKSSASRSPFRLTNLPNPKITKPDLTSTESELRNRLILKHNQNKNFQKNQSTLNLKEQNDNHQTLCPFVLLGTCNDENCSFDHINRDTAKCSIPVDESSQIIAECLKSYSNKGSSVVLALSGVSDALACGGGDSKGKKRTAEEEQSVGTTVLEKRPKVTTNDNTPIEGKWARQGSEQDNQDATTLAVAQLTPQDFNGGSSTDKCANGDGTDTNSSGSDDSGDNSSSDSDSDSDSDSSSSDDSSSASSRISSPSPGAVEDSLLIEKDSDDLIHCPTSCRSPLTFCPDSQFIASGIKSCPPSFSELRTASPHQLDFLDLCAKELLTITPTFITTHMSNNPVYDAK